MCGRNRFCKYLFLLYYFMPCCIYSEDALLNPNPLLLQQMSLSSAVRSALLDSRQQMTLAESYSNLLQTKIDSLEMRSEADKEELTRLSTRLTYTMNSLKNLSSELDGLNWLLEQERQKILIRNRQLAWVGFFGGVIILFKIAAFILYAKRLRIPRWLDILL